MLEWKMEFRSERSSGAVKKYDQFYKYIESEKYIIKGTSLRKFLSRAFCLFILNRQENRRFDEDVFLGILELVYH